jgi:hypothetical protein
MACRFCERFLSHTGWNPVSDMSAPRPTPTAYRGVYCTLGAEPVGILLPAPDSNPVTGNLVTQISCFEATLVRKLMHTSLERVFLNSTDRSTVVQMQS